LRSLAINSFFLPQKIAIMKKAFLLLFCSLCFAGASAQLKVTPSGYVGIGTDSPQERLDVAGAILAHYLGIKTGWNEGPQLMLTNTWKTTSGIASTWKIFNMTGSYTNSLQFWAYDSLGCENGGLCAPRLILTDEGRVGIGRMPTSIAKLDVAGSIAIDGSIVLSSDARLKKDIRPLTDEKNKLYLLEGKSYKKLMPPTGLEELSSVKADDTEYSEYGYLAQDLQKIFPDLVTQTDKGYYSVNYIGLIPVVVEALKDQKLEIEKQREQIKQLVKLINIKAIDGKAFEENGTTDIPLLYQNTPNPFNQTTEIGYYIPETVKVANIYIYDINGAQQKNIAVDGRGAGTATLEASSLKAGIYFYTLICDATPIDSKQMILTK
jgi:hypothetical protein